MVIIRADWIPTGFQIGDKYKLRTNKEQLFFKIRAHEQKWLGPILIELSS